MSSLLKPFRMVRNHWKKSVFFSCVALYGYKYLETRNRIYKLMTAYCEEAMKYGDESWHPQRPLRHLTVVLNPVCNKRRSKKLYEKYIQPIFHCAGLKISLVETETEGQTRDYMKVMSNTDGVVIVGGDGSIHEAITGYLRRDDLSGSEILPMAFLPTGKRNYGMLKLFGIEDDGSGEITCKVKHVQILGKLAMNVIREVIKPLDVIKIQKDGESEPLFAFYSVDFGFFWNVLQNVDKYWYYGDTLKPYYPLIKSLYLKDHSQFSSPRAVISYTKPCSGCSKCFEKFKEPKPLEAPRRWWQLLIPRPGQTRLTRDDRSEKMKSKINEECGHWHEIENTDFLNFSLRNSFNNKMSLYLHPSESTTKSNLLDDGVNFCRNKMPNSSSVGITEVGDLQLRFVDVTTSLDSSNELSDLEDQDTQKDESLSSDKNLSIDRENYPINNFQITLLPNRLRIYGY
ncbi:acylglycerol kinase-like protein Mulk [Brevipalpus obovatus]|uniref:acylglycerol kinase-like protein Mulk n=1 Tax=Brevipalpus obovatus TaxID=246614 RepID=UPI003D9E4624